MKNKIVLLMAVMVVVLAALALVALSQLYVQENQNIGKTQPQTIQTTTEEPLSCTSTGFGFEIQSAKRVGTDIEVEIKNSGRQAISGAQIVLKGERYDTTTKIMQTIPAFGVQTMQVTPEPAQGEIKEIITYPLIQSNPCMNRERMYDLPLVK